MAKSSRFLRITFLTSFVVATVNCVVLATTYSWNSRVRPVVLLSRAHADAEMAISDRSFYCIKAELFGNKEGAAKPGSWHFLFAHESGMQKYVSVNMDGKVAVTDYLPVVSEPSRIIGRADDVNAVFTDFLKVHSLSGSIRAEDGEVVVSVNARKFMVYAESANGEYSVDLKEVVGPSARGFVLRVREEKVMPTRNIEGFTYAPYYARAVNRFSSTDPERELIVTLDYGNRIPAELVSRILDMFGSPKE